MTNHNYILFFLYIISQTCFPAIFDLTSKDYEDAYFVTDSTVCGPGFRGYYEQVPCTQTEEPTTLFTLPTTAPTTNRPASCGRSITEQSFTVQVFSYQNPTCSFDVYRTDVSACLLYNLIMQAQ